MVSRNLKELHLNVAPWGQAASPPGSLTVPLILCTSSYIRMQPSTLMPLED